jgi:hypothetical protein
VAIIMFKFDPFFVETFEAGMYTHAHRAEYEGMDHLVRPAAPPSRPKRRS